MSKIYENDGVNVNLGDVASKAASKHCIATYGNSFAAEVIDTSNGNFRGPRGIKLKPGFEDCIWSCAPDGIGTKVVITDAAGMHNVSAFDIAAMTSFDLIRYGGLPIYMTSVLDVSSLGDSVDDPKFKATLNLYKGMKNAADELGIIMLNGETAELSNTVTSNNFNATLEYNWGGSVHGLYHPDKMITGEGIKDGDVIIAFKENGFRSNGISSVRKAFAMKFGENWFNEEDAQLFIKQAAEPSVLYDKIFVDANGWTGNKRIPIKSIVHLTGGSFGSKLGHDVLFPLGLSANLDNLFEIPDIMRECANWRHMSDQDLYETWNGGQGAIAIVDASDVDKILKLAKQNDVKTLVAGSVSKYKDPTVIINSKLSKGAICSFN
jgi:phosphoribosylformylglycinamidine cyclo-ligase